MESLDRAPEEGRTFRIRNMVCDRCILVVRDLFTRLGLELKNEIEKVREQVQNIE